MLAPVPCKYLLVPMLRTCSRVWTLLYPKQGRWSVFDTQIGEYLQLLWRKKTICTVGKRACWAVLELWWWFLHKVGIVQFTKLAKLLQWKAKTKVLNCLKGKVWVDEWVISLRHSGDGGLPVLCDIYIASERPYMCKGFPMWLLVWKMGVCVHVLGFLY